MKGSKNAKDRATKVQIKERADFTERLMNQKKTHDEIVSAICENFGLSVSRARVYMTMVYKRWNRHPELDRVNAKVLQVRRLFKLLDRAEGDLENTVKIETLLAKILGTLAPKELSGPDGKELGFRVEISDYRSSK